MLKIFSSRKKKDPNEPIEQLLGQRCRVVEIVDNFAGSGLVRVKNQLWAARSIDDTVLNKDEELLVVAREGVKLVCKRRK